MPVVNAPFRLYWAYNLSVLSTSLQPPVVADRSFFPNDITYQNAVNNPAVGIGAPIQWNERKSMFRFSVGRTF